MMSDEDLRDVYIKSVLNEVGTVLSGKDLLLVQNAMCAKFEGFTLTRTCKDLVVDDGSNADIIKKFFIAKKIEGLSEKSLRVYFYHLRSTFERIPKRIQDINVTDIRLSLADTMTNSSKINADNQRRILASFFTWCEEEEIIERSPMRKIKKIKFPEHIRRPTKSTVTRLADAFGVKADTLVIEVEREAKSNDLTERSATKQPAPTEPEEEAAEEICGTAPEAPAPEKERPDIAADEPAAVDPAGAYYIRPDFILVNKSVYNDIQPTLISTASISSINIDLRNPKIWIRRSIGSDKDEVMVEVFDDFDARDERWEELMEFFKTRGILG